MAGAEDRRRARDLPRAFAATLGLGFALGLASCHPGDVTDVSQLDVVITTHDPQANFQALARFAMPDSIVEIKTDTATQIAISHDYDDEILGLVRDSLVARGFAYETDPVAHPPEAVVLVAAMASEFTYTTYSWSAAWGWWPGWGSGWGSGWGYVPPPGLTTITLESGTIVVEMLDVRDPDTTAHQVPGVWAAALRGLILGTSAEVRARIDRNLKQAFEQSPYLRRDATGEQP